MFFLTSQSSKSGSKRRDSRDGNNTKSFHRSTSKDSDRRLLMARSEAALNEKNVGSLSPIPG